MSMLAPNKGHIANPTAVRRTDPLRRDRIIDATLDIIAGQGTRFATYRTVAEATNVPLGSMTYHFPSHDDLIFAAFELFADDLFSPLKGLETAVGDEDPRERLVKIIVSDERDRQRDMVLLAELYVLAFRHERYADLMRQWMRKARDVISRNIDEERAHVIDAVQEGLGLHRYFLPEEFGEDIIRHVLFDLVPQKGREDKR
jgi:DNA-binding transcriptional regulator YbjK